MYAIVIHVSIQDQAAARNALEAMVIPMLKGAPGFVSATFVALDDSHGTSIQVFETEEQARAAAPPAEGPGMDGVTLGTIEFGTVIAAA